MQVIHLRLPFVGQRSERCVQFVDATAYPAGNFATQNATVRQRSDLLTEKLAPDFN